MNNALMPNQEAPKRDKPDVDGALRFGGIIAVVFVFGALLWSAFAPLESAAVASGTIVVDGNRKTIQHLEGGLIDTIHVREGQSVKAEQVLITLDDTTARATLDLLLSRKLVASALVSRLLAERDGAKQITFPNWMVDKSDDEKVAQIIDSQRKIFAARSESRHSQSLILNQRARELAEEISGLSDLIKSEDKQISLIDEEIKGVATLLAKGLARKPRMLKLQRELAQLEGTRNLNRAKIARVKQSISETQMRVSSLKTELVNETVQEMRSTQAEIYDLEERIRAASGVLKRIQIKAPITGKVVGLNVYTQGGVIMPGEALMDIVPLTARLVVDTKIEPNDIDVVEEGLGAEVRLTALKQRGILPLKGSVVSVSADQLIDEATQKSYYLARIELTEGFKLPEGIIMKPGMQTEVMIKTGERSALVYALEPLTDSFNRAFRED